MNKEKCLSHLMHEVECLQIYCWKYPDLIDQEVKDEISKLDSFLTFAYLDERGDEDEDYEIINGDKNTIIKKMSES